MLNQSHVDRIFHALADPTRRAMLEQLSSGPASVSELAKPRAISLAAVVQHLAVLEESGVVQSQKIGRVRSCQLKPDGLRLAERWITERRSVWERRFDRLGELLESPPAPSTPTSRKKR
jgi:DNA-binding transcriptional ArsR family regulator